MSAGPSDLADTLNSLSLSMPIQAPSPGLRRPHLHLCCPFADQRTGDAVPISSTLEIKTRTPHKPLSVTKVAPQLYFSQATNLVCA
jgi:hypothetical protein